MPLRLIFLRVVVPCANVCAYMPHSHVICSDSPTVKGVSCACPSIGGACHIHVPTAALSSASPKVKEDTLGWLREAVGREGKPALTKLAPVLLPPAAKCAEEAAPSLREAAMSFMVAFAIKVSAACARKPDRVLATS